MPKLTPIAEMNCTRHPERKASVEIDGKPYCMESCWDEWHFKTPATVGIPIEGEIAEILAPPKHQCLCGCGDTLSGEYPRNQAAGLGTVWVANGQGSTWAELYHVFESLWDGGLPVVRPDEPRYFPYDGKDPNARTNLKLTGATVTDYDRK